MRSARIALAAGLLALAAGILPVAPAGADFGPIHLVSRTVPEQAEKASAPALSADGRYVAFQGTIDEGRAGVFRADLQTGVIARVATGSAYEPSSPGADAAAPSISADGRYVSFTTRARLDPVDDTGTNTDVYVADMSASPPTYELASAMDGSSQAMSGDSLVAPRVALSADGRRVAFVNGGQVYLRDLDTKTTTLVSVRRNPETGATEPGAPVPGGATVTSSQLPLLRGAALSADGTTVAWVGIHLPEQAPLLADEAAAISQLDAHDLFPYIEPLWRRVADGPEAETRRIVGGGDPLAPGCPGTAGTLAEPACRGPFPGLTDKDATQNPNSSGWLGPPAVDGIPQLSADGRTVALIGNPTEATNVFLVDMSPGLSRVQALRQLTRQVPVNPGNEGSVVNIDPYIPLNGHVFDLAISPDGSRVALATARQRFPLAPPNLVSPALTQLGLVELYVINLETEALRRVTHGLGGATEPSLGSKETETAREGIGATAPSFGAGGRLIAFSSTASNLVAGDGNDASDVFTVEDESSPPRSASAAISPPPPAIRIKRRRRLALTAFSLPDGRVRLVAVVPGSGTLRARVWAAPAAVGHVRSLDAVRAGARAAGPVRMTLAPPRRLRHLAHSREGLYATARVSFHSASGRSLHGQLQVRFHTHRARRPSGGGG